MRYLGRQWPPSSQRPRRASSRNCPGPGVRRSWHAAKAASRLLSRDAEVMQSIAVPRALPQDVPHWFDDFRAEFDLGSRDAVHAAYRTISEQAGLAVTCELGHLWCLSMSSTSTLVGRCQAVTGAPGDPVPGFIRFNGFGRPGDATG
jgi:hypothetical protein